MDFLFGALVVTIPLTAGRKEEPNEYVMGKRENGLDVSILKFESPVNYIRQTAGKNRIELGVKMQDRGADLIARVPGVLPTGGLGWFC